MIHSKGPVTSCADRDHFTVRMISSVFLDEFAANSANTFLIRYSQSSIQINPLFAHSVLLRGA